MSDQTDAFTAKALEAGLVTQPAPGSLQSGEGEPQRPELPWVQLPVDVRINRDFNSELER